MSLYLIGRSSIKQNVDDTDLIQLDQMLHDPDVLSDCHWVILLSLLRKVIFTLEIGRINSFFTKNNEEIWRGTVLSRVVI